MDLINEVYETALEYPKNLIVYQNVPHSDILDSYFKRLNDEQTRLFQKESEVAALDFLDLDDHGRGELIILYLFKSM